MERGGVLAGLVGANGLGLEPAIAWQFSTGGLVALATGLLVSAFEPAVLRLVRGQVAEPGSWTRVVGAATGIVASLLFILSVLRVVASSYSPFLYFRF